MSYKRRTRRIFSNLNFQTNFIEENPNLNVDTNMPQIQPETLGNNDLDPSGVLKKL